MRKFLLLLSFIMTVCSYGTSVYASDAVSVEAGEVLAIEESLDTEESVTDEAETVSEDMTEEAEAVSEDVADEAEAVSEDVIVNEETTERAVGLPAVNNLRAISSGKNKVKLTWDSVEGADQYIIYRQIGKSKFSYLYITPNTSYIDTTASGVEYNFYRVYPTYTTSDGTRILGASTTYVYAKGVLPAVKNLKAESIGKNRVRLTWSKVEGADQYIIYRQIGKSKFTYRYITPNTSYIDTTASDEEMNYYRIYPAFQENGKYAAGISDTYVFAKGVLPAVTGLKAQVMGKGIKLTWNKVSGAQGYIIYRKEGDGAFQYLYVKDANSTSYVDNKCSGGVFNYYRVYPYYKKDGKMIAGVSNKYVYGRITIEAVNKVVVGTTGYGEMTICWEKSKGAQGYYILRLIGENTTEPEVIAELTNGNDTTYVDTTASTTDINYYLVLPYMLDGKQQQVFPLDEGNYVGGYAIDEPINSTEYSITGFESYTNAEYILKQINKHRQAEGLMPLVMDKDLQESAMQRAAELVFNFSHTRPNGFMCDTVNPKIWGENIALGTYPLYDGADIMEMWMNSEGHRSNILSPEYQSVGVGCFVYDGIAYWVQLFGGDIITQATPQTDGYATHFVEVFQGRAATSPNSYKEETILIGDMMKK